MIWFCVCDWVLIWVEVMGSDGSGSGCGRWWLVAVSVAGGGWWLVAVSVAVVVGFVFAVVF